jgi:hypothetical protein
MSQTITAWFELLQKEILKLHMDSNFYTPQISNAAIQDGRFIAYYLIYLLLLFSSFYVVNDAVNFYFVRIDISRVNYWYSYQY